MLMVLESYDDVAKSRPQAALACDQKLLGCLQSERAFLLEQIENLRVPVAEAHRAAWEKKARVAELAYVKTELDARERRLAERREELVRAACDNDALRVRVPFWEADRDAALALARPRLEELRWRRGVQPEKIGNFGFTAECLGGGRRGSRTATVGARAGTEETVQELACAEGGAGEPAVLAGPGAPTVIVDVTPLGCDAERELLHQEQTRGWEKKVMHERKENRAALQALETLDQTEEQESGMMLEAISQQLERVRSQRNAAKGQADWVMRLHLRLLADHREFVDSSSTETAMLNDQNSALEHQLMAVAVLREQEVTRAAVRADGLRARAAEAHESGIRATREDAALCQEQMEIVDEQSARHIGQLEARLTSLRERYRDLQEHRGAEVVALREDLASLRSATLWCERLAARCAASGLATAQGLTRSGACGGVSSDNAQVSSPEEANELAPALVHLRQLLERCWASLGEERRAAGLSPAAQLVV